MKTIIIDGKEFVEKSSVSTKQVKSKAGKKLCIIRTYSAGVWLGYVDYKKADFFNCEVLEATRIWKWNGAFTLSALAVEGTTDIENCRFAVEVPELKLNRAIEFIPVSKKALKTFNQVKRG